MKQLLCAVVLIGMFGAVGCGSRGPGNRAPGAYGRVAGSQQGFRPGGGFNGEPSNAQVQQLLQERARLQTEVVECEGEVARWQSEVSSRPESLVAPVGLSTARNSLTNRRSQLAAVEARLAAMGY
jgi:hypothetical protein